MSVAPPWHTRRVSAQATPEQRARLLRRATAASAVTALALTGGKAVAWSITGSVALLASLVDSTLDTGASLITAVAVRYSLKPPDEDHRFGHGKSEALAGLAQAVFIGCSAAFLVVYAVKRFVSPQPLAAVPIGIAVMLVSVAATTALVLYQRRVVRATGSDAIRADALHYASDLFTNLATLAALGLASFGLTRLDPVFAVAIALTTLYGAAHIGRDTLHVLMDRELSPEVQERIRNIALAHAEVAGVHDLRTRQSGATLLIQFHLEMDGRISLHDAHRISDEVERALLKAFPGSDVVIHEDPAGEPEPRQFE
jgi:ferrous-iron efflux pump FieF